MVGHWPDDLVAQLVVQLPVKSLIRFKSVAKSWCALFETPEFIHKHLNISRKHAHLLVLHDSPMKKKLFVDETLQDSAHVPVHLDDIFPDEGLESVARDIMHFRVYDGLFCFYKSWNPASPQLLLCNVATREAKVLPKLYKPQGIPATGLISILAVGFLADLSSLDYKVFVCREFQDEDPVYYDVFHAAMYSTGNGSWRELDVAPLDRYPELHLQTMDSRQIDGVYYWVWFEPNHNEAAVLTFRMDDEVFQEIPGPLLSETEEKRGLMLFKHRGCVCIVVSHGYDSHLSHPEYDLPLFHDIWVMNCDGYWTKQWRIELGPLYGIMQVLMSWMNNLLILSSANGELFSYCLHTGKMTNLGVKNRERWETYYATYTYEESLVKLMVEHAT